MVRAGSVLSAKLRHSREEASPGKGRTGGASRAPGEGREVAEKVSLDLLSDREAKLLSRVLHDSERVRLHALIGDEVLSTDLRRSKRGKHGRLEGLRREIVVVVDRADRSRRVLGSNAGSDALAREGGDEVRHKLVVTSDEHRILVDLLDVVGRRLNVADLGESCRHGRSFL